MREMQGGLGERLRRLHLQFSGSLDQAEPLPPPTGLQARLLPAADLVMVLLYSRSRAGSLRSVRLRWSTITLAAAVFAVAGAGSMTLLIHAVASINVLFILGGVLAAALAIAGGILALFGVLQRLAVRRSASAR
jgi:hypothetical protein